MTTTAPRRPRRNLVLTLLPDEWDRLVRYAISAQRDPHDQARWLVLRGLAALASAEADADEAVPRTDVA